jgi:hypothetical protein
VRVTVREEGKRVRKDRGGRKEDQKKHDDDMNDP